MTLGGFNMTITYYDRFAVLPKRCDKCNRLFMWEGYNINYGHAGIPGISVVNICCKECIQGEKNGKNNGMR